jgi:hypothetical protein
MVVRAGSLFGSPNFVSTTKGQPSRMTPAEVIGDVGAPAAGLRATATRASAELY